MSERAHLGPLDRDEGDFSLYRLDESGECHIVAEVVSDTSDEHSARIVSCVNACEGIADPEEAIPAMRKALRRLVEEFDSGIYDAVDRDERGNMKRDFDAARDALRLAEGGQS